MSNNFNATPIGIAEDISIHAAGQIVRNVLIGVDGTLFLFDGGQRQFAHLTGECVPTTVDVDNFFSNLELRSLYCKAREILYYHIVFPSKPVVLTEMLPLPWQEKVKSLFLEQYVARLGKDLPNYIIYPRDLLRQVSSQSSVFRKLDTHMSDFGALAVTGQILEKLGIFLDIKNQFFESTENQSGDLARMLGAQVTNSELRIRPVIPPFYFDNRLALPSNTNNLCIAHNPHAQTERRLLIFGDSFFQQLLPYLSPAFRDIVYVRSSVFQPGMLELYKPDVVLTGNAERYLAKVQSDNDAKAMLHWSYGNTTYKPSESFIQAYKAQFAWGHHRNVYETWRKEIDPDSFTLENLGICKPNKHVTVLSKESLSFYSTGNDPILLFPLTNIETGTTYTLEITLETEVSSAAKVYFSDALGPGSFSESRAIRLPVTRGVNQLCFILDYPSLGKALRIDPLDCAGDFRLSNVSLCKNQRLKLI